MNKIILESLNSQLSIIGKEDNITLISDESNDNLFVISTSTDVKEEDVNNMLMMKLDDDILKIINKDNVLSMKVDLFEKLSSEKITMEKLNSLKFDSFKKKGSGGLVFSVADSNSTFSIVSPYRIDTLEGTANMLNSSFKEISQSIETDNLGEKYIVLKIKTDKGEFLVRWETKSKDKVLPLFSGVE